MDRHDRQRSHLRCGERPQRGAAVAERASSASVTLAGRSALRRYSRHLLIPEVGLAGQERLASSRALVIGAGGLGSPALQYLAAAGVGRIGIVDDDTVDVTNLQRQTLFTTADVGSSKATVAARHLHALNPDIAIDAIAIRFDQSNARDLVRLYDLVLDCTDRFSTRYLINDACAIEGRPDVYASIFRFDGQVSVFGAGGPCYRCLYPSAPPAGTVPTCAEGGVLGVLAGIVGSFQAAEALKLLLGIGEPLRGRLLLIDALGARVREVRFERDRDCALCGDEPAIRDAVLEEDDEPFTGDVEEIAPERLDDALRDAVLLDVREPHEAVLGSVDGAIAMPATQLEARMHELDSARRYVVACRVGAKSLWAVRRLRDAGFTRLQHLRGGLLAYAAQRADFDFF
ncbi:MAG: molybdopterin-synthase adenylyltransferase MoeB [Candidatus Eremiobacteraeota bacterium]|nr:molybdopterin-synthase adenylyltransferase MoeB [Candidatus Eremiobacteraeota bacterium]